MREIKFRAWDTEEKKYVTGPFDGGYLFINLDGELITFQDDDGGKGGLWEHGMDPIETHRIIVEQLTGLKDKNNKEIYEGDILSIGDGENEKRWTVQWSLTPYTAHYDFGYMPRADYCLVIGNIQENPELRSNHEEN